MQCGRRGPEQHTTVERNGEFICNSNTVVKTFVLSGQKVQFIVYLGILDDYESRHVVAAPVKLNMKYTTLKDQEPLSAGGGARCIKFIWIGNSKEVIYRSL